MLIIGCKTWHLSVVLVSMTIFGQNDFWSVSIGTVLILATIKLLRVLWYQKHRRLSHRKFLSGGNTWKTMAIRVFKNKPKSCMVAMQHTWGLIGGTELFLMENTKKEKSQSSYSNQPSCMLPCQQCNFLAGFWTLKSPLFFKYFYLRETFCGITFYASDIIIL